MANKSCTQNKILYVKSVMEKMPAGEIFGPFLLKNMDGLTRKEWGEGIFEN